MCLVGLAGTYQGLTATVLKQGTNQMIRFFVFTTLRNWVQGDDPSKDIGSVKTFCIGGVAGAASVFGNTPIDVVKTRMQVRKCGYLLEVMCGWSIFCRVWMQRSTRIHGIVW